MTIDTRTAANAIRQYGGVAASNWREAWTSTSWRAMRSELAQARTAQNAAIRAERSAGAAAALAARREARAALSQTLAHARPAAGGTTPVAANVAAPSEAGAIVTLSTAAQDAFANYILHGSAWQGSAAPGTPSNALSLTYSYIDPAYNYYSFNPLQITDAGTKSALSSALAGWASVSNLTFTEIAESGSTVGNLRIGIDAQHATAYAYLPTTGASAVAGDILLGGNQPIVGQPPITDWTTAIAPGSYKFLTLLHEAGHALGLRHPHDAGRDTKLFGTRLPTNGKAWDQLKYTVMSYRDSLGASVKTGYTIDWYPTTPMLHDIAAAQYLYGIDATANAGATTFAFAAGQQYFQTLYDTGGTDTFDASAQTLASRIDLRGGRFSTVGEAIHWSAKGKAASARDFVAIAYDSVIENAAGGSGHDVFYGNHVDNVMNGNGGNDTFVVNPDALTAGHDTVNGGAGGDTLVLADFGPGQAWSLSESGGTYTLVAANGYRVDATGVEYVAFGEKGIRAHIDDLAASFTAQSLRDGANRGGSAPAYDHLKAATIAGKPASATGLGLYETADGALFVAKGVKAASTKADTGAILGGVTEKTAATSLVAADGSLYALGAGETLRAFTRTKEGAVTLYVDTGASLKVLDFDADGNQAGSTRTVAMNSPALVDVELTLKRDLNGDATIGALVTQQLAFGATSGFYRASVGGTQFLAIAGPGIGAGKPLKAGPLTMTLKHADGSAYAPPAGRSLASYSYTTSNKIISGATITLDDGSTVSFDAQGVKI